MWWDPGTFSAGHLGHSCGDRWRVVRAEGEGGPQEEKGVRKDSGLGVGRPGLSTGSGHRLRVFVLPASSVDQGCPGRVEVL